MNDTVKLIIEIDEKTYKDIKNGKVYSSVRDVPQESVLAIAHGIPLDSVKAEIDKAYDDLDGYDPYALGTFANKVSEILDNIGKAESEVKPNEM